MNTPHPSRSLSHGSSQTHASLKRGASAPMPPCRRSGLQLAMRLALLALPVAASLPAPVAYAQAEQARSYAIPAGPLTATLNRYAEEAGIFVTAAAALTEGKHSAGLAGRYGVEGGLAALLQGSGLVAERSAAGQYLLRPAPHADTLLAPVKVVANELGTITEGSGSYAPGTIATATRLVLAPRETPQSISVITRQEMEDFGLSSIDEVMSRTPGISVITYDSERSEYSARGFSIDEFQYDGVPMQRNARYAAGNTLSDMAIYDRVEVLKGANGLLTGAGNPGASINLIRKKPTAGFAGHATVGAASWDSYRGELDVSGPLSEDGRLRGRAVAAYQDEGSFRDHYRRRTSVYFGSLEIDLAPQTLLTLGFDAQDSEPKGSSWGGIRLYDSEGRFNGMSRSFNPGARWSHWDQYSHTAFATLEHYFANEWVGKLQLNYQINGYDAALGSPNAYATFPDATTGAGVSLSGWLGKYEGEVESAAADAYFSGPIELFGRKHELVVGANLSRQELDGKNYWAPSSYDTSVPDYYSWNGDIPEPDWYLARLVNETTRQSGMYLTGRFNLADDWKLILGSRVSNYDYRYTYKAPGAAAVPTRKRENGVLTPYVGLVHQLDDTYSVYASHTTIFNPQSYQDEEGRALDPLEGINQEAGIKGEFLGGRLLGSLAYFRVEQDNYAERSGGRTPSGGTAYRATQGVVTRGFEIELAGELAPGWQMHAGYTHKVARRDGDKVTTLEPEDQFSLYTSYRLPGEWGKWTVGGGARWQGKTWDTVNHPVQGTAKFSVAGYWLADAMLRYRFDRQLSATLNIDNLFDKKYYTLMSYYDVYSYGDPRKVSLSVNYAF